VVAGRLASLGVLVGAASFACAACVACVACSSSSGGDASPAQSGPPGGAVAGPDDTHCAGRKQQTSDTSCNLADAGSDASSSETGTGGEAATYGATLYNAVGDDDACKYQVSWTSSDVYENVDVTFHLSLMRRFDGIWGCGANPSIEAFLTDDHPAITSGQHPSEVGTGTYDIGPIRFDAKGRWTVRFHLYGDCDDVAPDSPAGHVAFYVDVP